jgi:hypothetical protein
MCVQIHAHYKTLCDAKEPRHPIIKGVVGEKNYIREDWEFGYCDKVPKAK